MGRNAGARALRDTGSTTGVATAILALLSAGTAASISLVGAHQLTPAVSQRLRAGAPAAVHAPATVVVTPRVTATAPSSEGASHRRTSTTHVTARPAVLTSPTQHSQIRTPVTLPSVHVAHPVVTKPPVPTPPLPNLSPGPAVTAAPAPGYPPVPTRPRRHRSVDVVDAYTPSRPSPVAVLREKRGRSPGDNNACGQHAGGDHHDVYDGERGQGQDNGSGHDRGRDAGRDNSGNAHHGH